MKTKLTIFFLLIFFANIYAANNKISLAGRLLQANGKPLPYTEIELVPINSETQSNDPRLLAISNTSGRFSFTDVPEGKYTLSINFDEKPTATSPYSTFFYPNATNRAEAEVFEVTETSKFAPLSFRLPPKLVQRKISGQVVFTDGTPVADVFVFLVDVAYDETFSFDNKSDANGNFTLTAFENRKYFAGAVLFDLISLNPLEPFGSKLASTRSDIFTLDAKTEKIKLILEEPEEMKTLRRRNIGKLVLKP